MNLFREGLVFKAHRLLFNSILSFRRGLVFDAHRFLCHTTLGSRVMKNLLVRLAFRVPGSGFRVKGVGF